MCPDEDDPRLREAEQKLAETLVYIKNILPIRRLQLENIIVFDLMRQMDAEERRHYRR